MGGRRSLTEPLRCVCRLKGLMACVFVAVPGSCVNTCIHCCLALPSFGTIPLFKCSWLASQSSQIVALWHVTLYGTTTNQPIPALRIGRIVTSQIEPRLASVYKPCRSKDGEALQAASRGVPCRHSNQYSPMHNNIEALMNVAYMHLQLYSLSTFLTPASVSTKPKIALTAS